MPASYFRLASGGQLLTLAGMPTQAEIKALFTRVMDRMVEARWLQSHTYTDGKGHHLTWTASGSERAVCLKKIAETFRLIEGDDRPLAFDKAAHGESLEGTPHRKAGELDETLAAYWRESVAQLGLHGDEDGLLAMVHIVVGWAPDMHTPIKFGRAK